jgi:hypothetical protein
VYPQIDAADVGTRYRQPLLLHRNRGDATFDDVSETAGFAPLPRRSSRGAAFGDLDNDGDLDIVVVNLGEPPTLLRNRTTSGRRLLLELVGSASNRSAAGAQVTIRAGSLTQIAEVHAGVSYLSQNDLRVHFGLGESTGVDAVEVRWPNGFVERIGPLDVDRHYRIEEGKGVRRSHPLQSRK